jgi:cytochrome c oxidase assembly protein subunit 15
VRTPFERLAARWSVSPERVRTAAAATVATTLLIIVGGATVRVTGSGLGCPEWPNCTGTSFAASPEVGVHGWIEYGNRLLSVVICVAVGWLIIAARLRRPLSRPILRGAWLQFWIVVLNALVGGITVWMRLSPYIVAAHFLAAILLLTATTMTYARTSPVSAKKADPLSSALLATATALVVVGTAVTGTGPHAGDSSDVARMPFDRTLVTALHASLAAAVVLLTVLLLIKLPPGSRGRARLLLGALGVQALLGAGGVLTGENRVVTVLHVLGAALVWVGAVRVFLDSRVMSRAAVARSGAEPTERPAPTAAPALSPPPGSPR